MQQIRTSELYIICYNKSSMSVRRIRINYNRKSLTLSKNCTAESSRCVGELIANVLRVCGSLSLDARSSWNRDEGDPDRGILRREHHRRQGRHVGSSRRRRRALGSSRAAPCLIPGCALSGYRTLCMYRLHLCFGVFAGVFFIHVMRCVYRELCMYSQLLFQ